MNNFELLKSGLEENQVISKVEVATWITPRNPLTSALLVTFCQSNPPEYLDILGERARSKVYEYHDKPMMRKKMLGIQSHTKTMYKQCHHMC